MPYLIEEILPVAPYVAATPGDINAAGVIAGTLDGVSGTRDTAFVHLAGVTQARIVFELVAGASAVNALGDIVGTTVQPPKTDSFRPFQWLNGAAGPLDLMTVLPKTAVDGVGSDINDSRVVVGTFEVQAAGLKPHPFLYRNTTGDVVVLSPPGAAHAYGTAINAANQVVGNLWGVRAQGYVYELATGDYSALAFDPEGINDAGLIVGNRDAATPVMKNIGGSDVLLPTFGTAYCQALGVNNSGHVVGTASLTPAPGDDDVVAVRFNGANIVNLNDQLVGSDPWHVVAASDINDSGVIVGLARRTDDPSRRLRGVRLTPAPFRYELGLPLLVAKIFGGVAHGGGGFAWLNGQFVPVPSNNPEDWYRDWQRMAPRQRETLLGLLLGEIALHLEANRDQSELRALASRLVAAGAQAVQEASATRAPANAPAKTNTPVASARASDAKTIASLERRLALRGARRLIR